MSKQKSTLLSGGTIGRRTVLKGGGAAVLGAMVGTGFPMPAIAQNRVVHLGTSLPLTGPYEKVARIYQDGYSFWSETVGNKMTIAGEDYDVRWTIYDDENSAARTAQLTERLINTDKVDLIVGAYGTDTVLAQGAIAQRYGRITIQGGAASQRVDDEIGGHTTFTLVGQGKLYGRQAIDLLAVQDPKPRTLAIVTFDDPVYLEMAAGVKEFCGNHGIEVVMEEVLPMNTQDLRPTVLRMRRQGEIDVVYNCGWDLICINLVQEFLALDFSPKAFVGGHLTTNPIVKDTLGAKLRDIMGVTFWLPQMTHSDDNFGSAKEFADAFQASKGYAPTYHAAVSYTIPYLYQAILRDAPKDNPFDSDMLRSRLAGLQGLKTIWGNISFNEKGRIAFSGLPVLQWQGEDPQIVIVSPEDIATGQLVYPMQPFGERG